MITSSTTEVLMARGSAMRGSKNPSHGPGRTSMKGSKEPSRGPGKTTMTGSNESFGRGSTSAPESGSNRKRLPGDLSR